MEIKYKTYVLTIPKSSMIAIDLLLFFFVGLGFVARVIMDANWVDIIVLEFMLLSLFVMKIIQMRQMRE